MENKQTAMQLVDFSNPNADKIKSASTAKPMQNKQTAVELFIEELFKQIDYTQVDPKLIEQAKEMEKEQIKNAYKADVTVYPIVQEIYEAQAEQYYNETYGK